MRKINEFLKALGIDQTFFSYSAKNKSSIIFKAIFNQDGGGTPSIDIAGTLIGNPTPSRSTAGQYNLDFGADVLSDFLAEFGDDFIIYESFLKVPDGPRFISIRVGDPQNILIKTYDSSFNLVEFSPVDFSSIPFMIIRADTTA